MAVEPKKRRAPRVAHCIEDIALEQLLARCHDDGGCLVWDRSSSVCGPEWNVAGKVWSVRRLLWELTRGPIAPKYQVNVSCGCAGCVHPDHLVCRTRSAALRGRVRTLAERARIAQSKRAKATAVLSEALVREIRTSSETLTQIGRRLELAPSLVHKVRAHLLWRDYCSPFAGLGQRAA